VDDVRISPSLTIPGNELEIRTARSSGPGGQGVNTTDSKVELRWDIGASQVLDDAQRDRLLDRLASRIVGDTVLVIRSSEHRSQHRNREAATARLQAIVGEAVRPPKRRRRTRPTRASKERRLRAKQRRSELKRLRKPPDVP
jgi:ribosome-associated protein